MLRDTLKGLVIELPELAGVGIVIDATRQRKDLYKATVVCNDGRICILQFESKSQKVGEIINPIDYSFYDTTAIALILQ